jgi:hypothetical protein
MILLGIPKLVRFHKSRSGNVQVFNYLQPAIPRRGIPAHHVEFANG